MPKIAKSRESKLEELTIQFNHDLFACALYIYYVINLIYFVNKDYCYYNIIVMRKPSFSMRAYFYFYNCMFFGHKNFSLRY